MEEAPYKTSRDPPPVDIREITRRQVQQKLGIDLEDISSNDTVVG